MGSQECVDLFRKRFGKEPEWLVRCPGRVNLIGEHIDYSDYSVFPMAIRDSTWLAIGAGEEEEEGKGQARQIVLHNVDPKYPPFVLEIGNSFLNATANGVSPKWHHYFLAGWRGILEKLGKGKEEADILGQAKGMRAVLGSRIPPSAGLSSSSALVCAASLATICIQTGQTFEQISKKELAEIATKSERFVGMEGGGMDQACECLAQPGSALRIDFVPCLQWCAIRLPSDSLFAVLHSGRECNKGATSYYNERVVECRIGAQVIAKKTGALKEPNEWHRVRTLRDAAGLLGFGDEPNRMMEIVERYLDKGDEEGAYSRQEICTILGCSDQELAKHSLNSSTQNMQHFLLAKRAKHVYSEASRVLEFERVCKEGAKGRETLERMAALMNASHKSCAELFECSCPELDSTVQKCLEAGCLGARLTGAGWGGCVVALVDANDKQRVEQANRESGLEVLFWSEPCGGIEANKFNK